MAAQECMAKLAPAIPSPEHWADTPVLRECTTAYTDGVSALAVRHRLS
jgi:hypothetical protein